MPVTANDLKFYKSNSSDSDGGAISAVEITDNVKNNLFSDILGDEGLNGETKYKKIFLKNNSAAGLDNCLVWLESNTPSTDDIIYISKTTSVTGSNATGDGQNYVAPSSSTDPNVLVIGTISAGSSVALWLKRVVDPAPSAYDNNSVVIKISGNYIIT